MTDMVADQSHAAPPGAALQQMILGFTVSQAISVTAKLGIVDVLHDGPKTSPEIADAIGVHEPALRRLLRALTTVDILVEGDGGRFAPTAEGGLLRSDHPHSLRWWAIILGAPFIWRPWGALEEAIVTGKPSFDHIFGEGFFTYLERRPEDGAMFHAMATSNSAAAVPALLAAYDFSGCTRIVDVGGGEGALLRGILEQYPNASGVLYDLPSVVAGADTLREPAMTARCEIVGGDMFQSVPAGGDAYVLKHVIHDWSDSEAIQILRQCREAISDAGKILLIESVVTATNGPDVATKFWNTAWEDLQMLVLLSGRERTEADFQDLYEAAGFQVTRIMPVGGHAIIEGVPV